MQLLEQGVKSPADWLALSPSASCELIDGQLIEKAAPTYQHGTAQAGTVSALRGPFHRRATHDRHQPGGWWIATEVDVQLGERIFRPDIVGWRRVTAPELPSSRLTTLRPEWICEVVSESNGTADTVHKLRYYHEAAITHYWLIDPRWRTLTVYRYTPAGYLVSLVAGADEHVYAEPFHAVPQHVATLLGEDPD